MEKVKVVFKSKVFILLVVVFVVVVVVFFGY